MTARFKMLGVAGLVCIFAVLFTSCATHSKLGCPMKISKSAPAQKAKEC
jgi:hypothetical protein